MNNYKGENTLGTKRVRKRGLILALAIGMFTISASCMDDDDDDAGSSSSSSSNSSANDNCECVDQSMLDLIDARYKFLRCQVQIQRLRELYDVPASDPDDGPLSGGSDGPLVGGHDGPLVGGHDGPLVGGHDAQTVEEREEAVEALNEATIGCQEAVTALNVKYGPCATTYYLCVNGGTDVNQCATEYQQCLDVKHDQ